MVFRRRLRPKADVDIVPLIDVMFQLVVFFMVSSTFIVTPGISLLLPESSSAEPVAMSKLVVSIISPDEVYVNQDRYALSSLDGGLKTLSEEDRRSIKTVVVEGDSGVSYSLMVSVLDVLRQNGFKGINLKTREAEKTGNR
jgi:biopolymer transport protein ExbD